MPTLYIADAEKDVSMKNLSRKEAITLLRNLEDSLDSYCGLNEEGKTAFRMAIEALNCSEIPNSSDTISRQGAIDAVVGCTNCGTEDVLRAYVTKHSLENGWTGGIVDALDAIEQLPSAQPEQRWIPVSERLPDDLAEVNITWINHKPEPYYDFTKDKPFTASAVYYKGDWYWYSSVCADLLAEYGENEIDKLDDAIEITAWMPLPEPYQGEQ